MTTTFNGAAMINENVYLVTKIELRISKKTHDILNQKSLRGKKSIVHAPTGVQYYL